MPTRSGSGSRSSRTCAGPARLVFVSDLIPPELRRVIEFLNERMSPTEVVGVEIRQYVGDRDLKTMVPRVVGQTEQARIQKIGGSRPMNAEIGWNYYETRLPPGLDRPLYRVTGGQPHSGRPGPSGRPPVRTCRARRLPAGWTPSTGRRQAAGTGTDSSGEWAGTPSATASRPRC